MKWEYNEKDKNIEFLIKTMKHQHLDDTLKRGVFCFNYPTVFNASTELFPGQFDKWDSHLSFDAMHIMYAPIISEDENGPHYGPVKKLGSSARVHSIANISKMTPLCSFRKVEEEDVVRKYDAMFFRLSPENVDRIKRELGHDSFILITHPYQFLKRFAKVDRYFARSIHYGEIDEEFCAFLDSHTFAQKEMFQKSEEYAWQKEFRVIISPRKEPGPQFVEIGSIEDIAFGGNIDNLCSGFIFAENEQNFEEAKRKTLGKPFPSL